MSFLKIPTVPQFLLTDTSDSGSDREDETDFQIDSDIIANHTRENVETTKKVATSIWIFLKLAEAFQSLIIIWALKLQRKLSLADTYQLYTIYILNS